MLRLQLLGGVSLASCDQVVSGAVTQRRRLALLAILGATDGRPVSRDRAVSLLWPDSEAQRARHLLSEALHVIRKALGEDLVVAAGDDLRLNLAAIAVDVVAFRKAIETGDAETAITLYEGPFVEGFFLPDNGEFERWTDGERARLAGAYGKALESVAMQRTTVGDLGGALEVWRRLAHHDHCNTRIALGLMQALEATGDRAGALRHLRVHEQLLRQEFGIAADPQLLRFAECLRSQPVSPAVEPRPTLRADDGALPAVLSDEAARPGAGDATARSPDDLRADPRPTGRRGARATDRLPYLLRGRSMPGPAMRLTGLVALLAVVVVAVLSGRPGHELPSRAIPPASGERLRDRSIAVLAFADMSPARDHEWFSEGITDEIINALGRLDGMRVAARTSAFGLKNRDLDVREIGSLLGVAHVLEGSVRRADDRLRVTVLLISTADGYRLWSRTFERDLRDVFAVQDEIAQAVVETLRLQLADRSESRLVVAPTDDLEAYSLYLQGRHFWSTRTPQGLARGLELFQQAIERDPGFARAYVGLADSHSLLVTGGAVPPREGYERARAAAEHALALDPSLGEAHAALGLVMLYSERDWQAAGARFALARQLTPGYATGRHWYAMYLAYQGRFEEAMLELEQARQLDPLSPAILTAAGSVQYYARRYGEAVAHHRAALAIDPNFWPAHLQLGAAYLQQGRATEAMNAVREAERLSAGHPLPTALLGYAYAVSGRGSEARLVAAALENGRRERYVSPAYLAAIHVGLGEHERAFEWLARAEEERDDWMIYLAVEPVFDAIRHDPRFAPLIAGARAPR
jgi:TolB-like protein/DNA-binding SARP family transcriptional activator